MADVGWSKGGSTEGTGGAEVGKWKMENGKVAGQLQELQGSAQATNDLFAFRAKRLYSLCEASHSTASPPETGKSCIGMIGIGQ